MAALRTGRLKNMALSKQILEDHVTDGDAGVRFNFPGVARFRAISWEEWFGNFREHNLLFVYERDDPSGTYRLIPKARLAGE